MTSATWEDDRDAAALIEAIARRGDRGAFARLFKLYAPRVKGQLRARGVSPTVAEEMTQEVMLTVWRKAAQFDQRRGNVAIWLFAITRNCLVSYERRTRWPDPDWRGDGPAAEGADDQLAAVDRDRNLRAAVDELPADQRDALVGAYYRERTMQQLADENALPIGTIKTRVRLALARLRARLEGNAHHDD